MTPGQSTGLPPFSFDRVQTPFLLKVTAAEKAETGMLVERVVQLINQGVTSMDLLEVFLSRRIQPLQARDHPMWMYSGTDDTARVHPEEVSDEMVALWLRSITGNKDNPRGTGDSIHSTLTTNRTRSGPCYRLYFSLSCNYF